LASVPGYSLKDSLFTSTEVLQVDLIGLRRVHLFWNWQKIPKRSPKSFTIFIDFRKVLLQSHGEDFINFPGFTNGLIGKQTCANTGGP